MNDLITLALSRAEGDRIFLGILKILGRERGDDQNV